MVWLLLLAVVGEGVVEIVVVLAEVQVGCIFRVVVVLVVVHGRVVLGDQDMVFWPTNARLKGKEGSSWLVLKGAWRMICLLQGILDFQLTFSLV